MKRFRICMCCVNALVLFIAISSHFLQADQIINFMIFFISEYCYGEAPLIIPLNSWHASLAFAIYPPVIRLFFFHFMALFTHLTFYLIFQALLIDGSNLTTSRQLTFLQNYTRDKPSVFHLFVTTSSHLLGSDTSFATCCLYRLSPAFVHSALASWHDVYSLVISDLCRL